ncbi:MAG: hypothetical protein JO345_34680 [Streptosporangiaceae bacterium]|nr:hypothetical protein [Streptosporangiaceae bacterium]
MIVTLTAAASLGLALPAATAYTASAAPAKATAVSTTHTGRVVPYIKWQECAGQTTTWVDLDMVNQVAGIIDDWCYGATGVWTFPHNPGYWISNICAGNNYGTFYYVNLANGQSEHWDFAPGHVMAGQFIPVALHISGWSGGDTCKS